MGRSESELEPPGSSAAPAVAPTAQESRSGLYADFSRRMLVIAAITGLFIALAAPAVYFAMDWSRQTAEAGRLAETIARRLRPSAEGDPGLWESRVAEFARAYDAVEDEEIAEISVYAAEDGAMIARSSYGGPSAFAAAGSSDIAYDGVVYGRVRILKRTESTLTATTALLLSFAILGTAAAAVLFRFPAAIVKRTEERVDRTIRDLDREVSERSRSEEEARQSLREKETLLKEVHHRVKNNLQVIISLLNLRRRSAGSAAAESALGDLARKVRTMAYVHEQLYASPSLSRVDMAAYLRALVASYRDYRIESGCAVSYDVSADGVFLPIDTAMPLGLIACELVGNSLKHAFPGRAEGRIALSVEKAGDGSIALAVRDDGVGTSAEALDASPRSLGIRLVRALAGQLRGELEIETRGGLSVRVSGLRSGEGEGEARGAGAAASLD